MNKKTLRKALQVYTFPAVPLSLLATIREMISFRYDFGRWPSEKYVRETARMQSTYKTAIRAERFMRLLNTLTK